MSNEETRERAQPDGAEKQPWHRPELTDLSILGTGADMAPGDDGWTGGFLNMSAM